MLGLDSEVILSTLDDYPHVAYDLSLCCIDPTLPIIDGNEVAAKMAWKLRATKLIIFSDMPSLMKDVTDPLSLIREITVKEVEGLLEAGIISGAWMVLCELRRLPWRALNDYGERGGRPIGSRNHFQWLCCIDLTLPIIDGNEVPAEIAWKLRATKLIISSDMPSLMKEVTNPLSLIRETTVKEVEGLLETGIISGCMKSKVNACVTALSRGVRVATILPWSMEGALWIDTLTENGAGTRIFPA
ncbi:hypothetical protein BUALT_Bualt16G0000500 [Buddleja alternifolia]|uniref:Aspartate/glutamate/uridylate kinase domain-containing protein n=1 Tax=Buddleja alternifolia TaxID=168488 RepID=A0AAV6WG73_9LAMI|nr:hypothetical protein BUALT_Bualt16G0000500 [Buddleja alternifolia]